jgi:hypothetical protein
LKHILTMFGSIPIDVINDKNLKLAMPDTTPTSVINDRRLTIFVWLYTY